MTRSRYLPVLHGAAADRPDETDTIVTAEAVSAALQRLGYDSEILHLGIDLSVLTRLTAARPALVFNLVAALDGDSARAQPAPAALDHSGLPSNGRGLAAPPTTRTPTAAKRQLRTREFGTATN